MKQAPSLAVDIGNARIKIGRFSADPACGDARVAERGGDRSLPEPDDVLPLSDLTPEFDRLADWLSPFTSDSLKWTIASVNRPGATRLINWLRDNREQDGVTLLSASDLPLEVRLERPDMVGIDRLVDAVAANRLREPNRPAAVVDVGSAITVDWIAANGAFTGGAILPGLGMNARAMHEFTDLLPLIDVGEWTEPPPALGRSTEEAMRSGLYWGSVGAVREIVARLAVESNTSALNAISANPARPQIFLTGGAGEAVARLLGGDARYVPHLTLAGVALSAPQR